MIDCGEQAREKHAEYPGAGIQRRRRKGRPLRATARFSADEWLSVEAAARRAGLTSRGWIAAVATAEALREPPPRVVIAEATLQELVETRKQLVQASALLAGCNVRSELAYLADRVEALISDVDRRTAALVSRGHA